MVHIGHCGGVMQLAARVLKWKIYGKPEAKALWIQCRNGEAKALWIQGRMRIGKRCEGQGRTDREQHCEYKKRF
jgi:hypothetical protein